MTGGGNTRGKKNESVVPKPYTEYTIYFRLERAHLLQTSTGSIDEEILPTLDPNHTDPLEFPRPPKYENIALPPYWYSSSHKKDIEKRRKHRKRAGGGTMDLKTLSKTISASWRDADREVIDYCRRLAKAEMERYQARIITSGGGDTSLNPAAKQPVGGQMGKEGSVAAAKGRRGPLSSSIGPGVSVATGIGAGTTPFSVLDGVALSDNPRDFFTPNNIFNNSNFQQQQQQAAFDNTTDIYNQTNEGRQRQQQQCVVQRLVQSSNTALQELHEGQQLAQHVLQNMAAGRGGLGSNNNGNNSPSPNSVCTSPLNLDQSLSMVPFAATSSEETFKSNNLLHRMTPRPNSSMSIQSGEHARGGDPSPSNNMSISPVPLLPTKRKYVRRASAPPEFMGMTAQQPGGGGVGGGRSLRSILKEGQGGFGDAGGLTHPSMLGFGLGNNNNNMASSAVGGVVDFSGMNNSNDNVFLGEDACTDAPAPKRRITDDMSSLASADLQLLQSVRGMTPGQLQMLQQLRYRPKQGRRRATVSSMDPSQEQELRAMLQQRQLAGVNGGECSNRLPFASAGAPERRVTDDQSSLASQDLQQLQQIRSSGCLIDRGSGVPAPKQQPIRRATVSTMAPSEEMRAMLQQWQRQPCSSPFQPELLSGLKSGDDSNRSSFNCVPDWDKEDADVLLCLLNDP